MYKRNYIVITAILFIIITSVIYANTEKVTLSKTDYLFNIKDGSTGIHKQPNGPFAVYYCCEYAQGNYIGVIFYDRMSGPVFPFDKPVWRIANRFWQDEEWAADVNNFAWGPDGKYLYVATSNIYGTGGIFELNLHEKKFTKIFPDNVFIKSHLQLEYGTEIIDIDLVKKTLKVKLKFGKESKVELLNISHK